MTIRPEDLTNLANNDAARQNLYITSEEKLDAPIVKGYDFNEGLDYNKLFQTLKTTGFQASLLGDAIDRVNEMINWRLSDVPIKDDETEELKIMENREKVRCTIFLGYTSNMSSCGMREYIRYLCQHKMIDCIVTTCGGIEEDFMKVLAPHYMGDFDLKGSELRAKNLNRIGNMIVPSFNYCKFETFLAPLIEEMH